MGVTILSGQAYIAATPSSQGAQVLRARASSNYTVYTINANASGSTKYDWIYLSVSAINANTPAADASNVTSIYTSRSSSNSSDNGTPPTYGLLLAVVTVANGASSITNGNISDRRVQASVSTAGTSNTTGWITGLATPNTVTALGNRSYSCVFNGTDLTGTVSNGMRLKLTRLVAAPTQSTSLNGTTQYYSKTSPAGMTFTGSFVVSAWVKMTSYVAGSIASRFNGSSGWDVNIGSTGQVNIAGFNAAAYRLGTSYQSIPLNKWVHIAAQIDMSNATVDATNTYIMIDGVSVPTSQTNGAAPTALVQAGNLEIGSRNGGTQPFPGKIAQVAIYSAKVPQATILASINQTLVGTETSLISAYSFNNSINDLNANANNLTANGSAVATSPDSPFAQGATAGSLEYGIVTSATFSTNTTLTVQVPEGCAIPTSGGVSAVSYSNVKVPYGFPAQEGKWTLLFRWVANVGNSASIAATWNAMLGSSVTFPVGEWKQDSSMKLTGSSATPATFILQSQWDSAAPTYNRDGQHIERTDTSVSFHTASHKHKDNISVSTATVYQMYAAMIGGAGAQVFYNETTYPSVLMLTLAHL